MKLENVESKVNRKHIMFNCYNDQVIHSNVKIFHSVKYVRYRKQNKGLQYERWEQNLKLLNVGNIK